MTMKRALFAGAAVGITALACGHPALAAVHKKKPHHAAAAAAAESETQRELRELLEQVQALQARLDAQGAQVQTAQAAAVQAQTQAQAAQTQVAQSQVQIEQLPDTVKTEVAKVAPKTDKIYYKGLGLTLGGFLEAASIYRDHFMASDIATGWNSIPYDNVRAGHQDETRFTARQSRLSLLAEGQPTDKVHLAMYGEFDFQAAAQTANSNESNSYNPRIRNLYGTVDWNDLLGEGSNLHLLAGQNWSLVTLNSKGITPRNEVLPPVIDAQYVPGFVWTRQPQVRLTGDFLDHKLWLAVSVENPQTTAYTTGGAALPSTVTYNEAGGSGFNSANNLSLNHVPDVVAKVAYENKMYDRTFHLEAFGIFRDFTDRVLTDNKDEVGGGGGAGLIAQIVPDRLDFQVSGLWGYGVGRYGSTQLPDVTFRPDGTIAPLEEVMGLAGATFHVDKSLDLYVFGGEEHVRKQAYTLPGGLYYGYGNPYYNNTGCNVEGGSCVGNTNYIDQIAAGLWKKLYQGPWGMVKVGVQYSYTDRQGYYGQGVAPDQKENIVFTSFRYYPFNDK